MKKGLIERLVEAFAPPVDPRTRTEWTPDYRFQPRYGEVHVAITTPPLAPEMTREEWERLLDLRLASVRRRMMKFWEDEHE